MIATVPLGIVGNIQGGLQVTAKRHSHPIEAPYLRVANVFKDRLDLNEVKILRVTTGELERTKLMPGDLLLVEGHGNAEELGRAAVWDGSIPNCTHQNHLIRVRLDQCAAEPVFVCRFLNAAGGRSQLRRMGKTTSGLNTISTSQVAALRVPLPPLAEQRRVAALLDEADALRRKRRESLALLDDLLRAIFVDMFGDPVANPKQWPVVQLRDACTFVGGGTPSRAQPGYFTGSICWATAKDMGVTEVVDTQEHITEEAIRQSATRLVPPGSVLVVVKSKVLAHTLPVAIARVQTCFGQDLKALVPHDTWPSEYLAAHLRVASRPLLERARGVNTEGLTLQHLREYAVIAPPTHLRRQYARIEQALRAERNVCLEGQRSADALFASLLDESFERPI